MKRHFFHHQRHTATVFSPPFLLARSSPQIQILYPVAAQLLCSSSPHLITLPTVSLIYSPFHYGFIIILPLPFSSPHRFSNEANTCYASSYHTLILITFLSTTGHKKRFTTPHRLFHHFFTHFSSPQTEHTRSVSSHNVSFPFSTRFSSLSHYHGHITSPFSPLVLTTTAKTHHH